MLKLTDFDYHLPPENIAHSPMPLRDHSRLLAVDPQTGALSDHFFYDLPSLLKPTDVLVRNNTKVMPARIFGHKTTGGAAEILLLKKVAQTAETEDWECLTKPGLKPGQVIRFTDSQLTAECILVENYGRTLRFSQGGMAFMSSLDTIGHTPIPPYIDWSQHDEARLRQIYQTTYAKILGSAAAPTAGLHFTSQLDQKLQAMGIEILEVTLHVGLGTFLPIDESAFTTGKLHHEWFELSPATATRLNELKIKKHSVIAVGTTTTRVLETCYDPSTRQLTPQIGETELFIYPPYKFGVVDGMITNFHLPKSSLLMLISALVSQPNTSHEFTTFAHSAVGKAYQHAISNGYRFYSFGDAMLIK